MKNGQMQAAIQQSSMMGETRLLRFMLTPKNKVFNILGEGKSSFGKMKK